MKALIVFESMYGNTHAIADSMASGLPTGWDVEVRHVGAVPITMVKDVDVLLVGGPTHAHSLSSPLSRKSAADAAARSAGALVLEPGVGEHGLREWLDALPRVHRAAAVAFDTRYDGPVLFTGRASKGIAARLAKRGYAVGVEPESFLVDKANHLLPGEIARAQEWAAQVASSYLVAH